jgi:hypothetical protein
MWQRVLRYLKALLTDEVNGRMARRQGPYDGRPNDPKPSHYSSIDRAKLRQLLADQELLISEARWSALRASNVGNGSLAAAFSREADDREKSVVALRRALERLGDTGRSQSDADNRLPLTNNITGLIYTGRNQRGVPTYSGDWQKPSSSSAWLLIRAGVLALFFGFMGLSGQLPRLVDPLPSVFGFALVGAGMLLLLGARMMFRACAVHDRLFSIDELCNRFGLPELSLLQEAQERGITPKRIVNGREYFDFTEFGEAAVLLRAAHPTDADQDLLRPAGKSSTEPELLLRTVGQDGPSPDN